MEEDEYTYYYEYKGNTYYVTSNRDRQQAKNPDTGKWFDVISYVPVDVYVNKKDSTDTIKMNNWGTVFVREALDFHSKFTPVKNPHEKISD